MQISGRIDGALEVLLKPVSSLPPHPMRTGDVRVEAGPTWRPS